MALKRHTQADIKKSVRATNVELHSREITASKDDKIYTRDKDNLYPLRIEKIINNSPTGRRSANIMTKYIAGNGVAQNIQVGKGGETLNDIIDAASNDIAYQYGVYFHRTVKINDIVTDKVDFKTGSIKVLDYVSMAKSKEDDDGFPGKYYFLKQNDSPSMFGSSKGSKTWFYPYNTDPKVILSQMQNDCKLKGIVDPTIDDLIRNYRGQVYYLNLTPKYIYALPLGDSVYNDMDTEFRISQYQNVQSRSGWLGKTVILKYANDEDDDGSDFNDTIKSNLGSENSADVLVVDIPLGATDDLNKAFVVNQMKPQYDDKLFEATIQSIRKNILGAFNNIPEVLLFAGTSLFGTGSETYLQAKRFYWEQNEYERFKLERTLSMLLGSDVNILPINGVENPL